MEGAPDDQIGGIMSKGTSLGQSLTAQVLAQCTYERIAMVTGMGAMRETRNMKSHSPRLI